MIKGEKKTYRLKLFSLCFFLKYAYEKYKNQIYLKQSKMNLNSKYKLFINFKHITLNYFFSFFYNFKRKMAHKKHKRREKSSKKIKITK